MKNLSLIILILALGGCLASTTSPDGIACDYSQGKPMWEMPLACQPNGG